MFVVELLRMLELRAVNRSDSILQQKIAADQNPNLIGALKAQDELRITKWT